MARKGSKGVKKKWYTIVAPKDFGNVEIGESLVSDANTLVGRTVKANLNFVTGQSQRHNTKLTFLIKEAKEGKALTEITKYELMSSYVRRAVHRDKTKIEDSILIKTKDNISARIKPLVLTRGKIKSSLRKFLKIELNKYLVDFCKNKNYDDIVGSLVKGFLQRDLRKKLSKIYPISISEVRIFQKTRKK